LIAFQSHCKGYLGDTKKTALVRPSGARSGKDQARPKEGRTSPNAAAERARLFFGKAPRSGKPGRAKKPKKWKAGEKPKKPNVAKCVTLAYFGLSKYATLLL